MTPKKISRRSSGDKLEGFAKVSNRSMEPKGVSESMVHFFEVINQENCDAQGNVRAGCLLRWMDICACLSAEKHGMLSSVTLSMDDLTFDMPAKLGDVLEISARVNNAFNTSMEVGVLVQSMAEKSSSNTHCKAYFTFVSLDHHGKKCKVPKIIPETESERDNYIMAKERRAMRFKKKDMIKEILDGEQNNSDSLGRRGSAGMSESSMTPTPWDGKKKRLSVMLRDAVFTGTADDSSIESLERTMSESALTMTKVVLPSDANHMGNTFGGNIMSWMDDAAVVCATKHCHFGSLMGTFSVVTIAVDAFSFLGPSKVGDRITFLAQVNRAFGTTMEVGVRVEAQALGGQSRHINTGYLTVIAKAKSNGRPTAIPKIKAGNEIQKQQHMRALARRKLRMERKKLSGSGGKSDGLAWTWTDEMSKEISIANIFGLLKVNNSFELSWESIPISLSPNPFQIRMEITKDTWGLGLMTIRISGVVTCPLDSMFKAVMGIDMRKKWDLAVAEYENKENIDEHNDIIWASYKELGSSKKDKKDKDFCLLRTWSSDDHRYIIASRSVVHQKVPPRDTHTRGEVFPSGFILTPWVMDDGLGRYEEVEQTR